MSKLLIGSINLSLLLKAAKAGHSSCTKANNGNVYCNVNVWLNDEKDRYDNDASIQINPKKDSDDEREYIGNLKFLERKENEIAEEDLPEDVEYAF